MSKKPDDIFEPLMPIVPPCWDILPFQQAASVISDNGRHVKQGAYLPAGKLLVIDQGQNSMGGYTDDETMAFNGELPVILFGDHTRSIKFVDKRFAVGAEGIKILKPTPNYNPKFFYYLLRSLQIPSRGYSRHFQFLKKFHLPIAPPNEQKLIVAEIEKQFSRLDEAVAGLKRIKANLKRYKAAVLKAAVEGKLTEEWRKAHPNVETGAELLKRILIERKKKWEEKNPGKKYKEPVAPDTSTLPDLPKGWVWATLDELLVDIEAGKSFKCEERPPTREEVGVVKVSAVTWGEFDEVASKTCLERRLINDRLLIHSGDFLFSRANTIELIGACVITKKVTSNLMLSDKILRFRLLGGLEKWVLYNLRSKFGRKEIESLSTGNQESMRNIGQDRIRAIRIPLPPVKESERIVAEIERRFSIVREIEIQVGANFKRAERLRQGILKKAFSGDLLRD